MFRKRPIQIIPNPFAPAFPRTFFCRFQPLDFVAAFFFFCLLCRSSPRPSDFDLPCFRLCCGSARTGPGPRGIFELCVLGSGWRHPPRSLETDISDLLPRRRAPSSLFSPPPPPFFLGGDNLDGLPVLFCGWIPLLVSPPRPPNRVPWEWLFSGPPHPLRLLFNCPDNCAPGPSPDRHTQIIFVLQAGVVPHVWCPPLIRGTVAFFFFLVIF